MWVWHSKNITEIHIYPLGPWTSVVQSVQMAIQSLIWVAMMEPCMYVCVCVYLFVFPHPREQTFYLKLESILYANNEGWAKPILHSGTGKLCLKGVFLSQSKTGCSDRPTDLEFGFPSWLFKHSTTEKQRTMPHGHLGNAYLVICKVGVTCTYTSKNEEQPWGFAGRILKE